MLGRLYLDESNQPISPLLNGNWQVTSNRTVKSLTVLEVYHILTSHNLSTVEGRWQKEEAVAGRFTTIGNLTTSLCTSGAQNFILRNVAEEFV